MAKHKSGELRCPATALFTILLSHNPLGADVAKSPAEVASQVTKVVTMLPESSHVLEVYTGKDGVLR